MELNLENSQFKLIDAPYPIGFVNNFLDEKNCEKLYREILDFSNYDDLVMSGRQRVNKGSKTLMITLKNLLLFCLFTKNSIIEIFI